LPGLVTTHAVQVVAGALSGVLAMSAAIATGVVPTGPSSDGPQTLALVGCPGSGSIVAVAKPGDQMLVTAKNADGSWLRVYVPGPVAKDGWVQAGSLELLADGSSLPVAACIQVAGATGVPGPSPTGVMATVSPTGVATPSAGQGASPTTKATAKPTAAPTATTGEAPPPTTGSTAPPPPTSAPTATPNVGPVFASGPSSSVPTMFGDPPDGDGDCWGLPRRTTIKVEVADPNGISGLQLFVQRPGATTFSFLHNFSNHGTYWSTLIDAYWDHIKSGGTMSFYVVATDGTGLKTTSKTGSVVVRQCDTNAAVTGGIQLDLDPDGAYRVPGNVKSGPVPWFFVIHDPDGSITSAVLSLTLQEGSYPATHQTVILHKGVNPAYWSGESTTYSIVKTTWVLTATDVKTGTTVVEGSAIVKCIWTG
jgi:hypothetical protein